MQVWPALIHFPNAILFAHSATDATEAHTTTGALPPSSITVGVKCSAAARDTIRPTAGDPRGGGQAKHPRAPRALSLSTSMTETRTPTDPNTRDK